MIMIVYRSIALLLSIVLSQVVAIPVQIPPAQNYSSTLTDASAANSAVAASRAAIASAEAAAAATAVVIAEVHDLQAETVRLEKELQSYRALLLGKVPELPASKGKKLRCEASGEYYVDFGFGLNNPLRLYVDLTDCAKPWFRLNYKHCHEFYPTSRHFQWSEPMVRHIIPHIKSFGFSDDLLTMHTDQSWYLDGVNISAAKTISYAVVDTNVSTSLYLTNVLNGRTPTGTVWNISYEDAQVLFRGNFGTFGAWTAMYEGCDYSSHLYIGNYVRLQTGGHIHHTGEYVHSGCNGYGSANNSITSRADWNNTRAFWVQIDL